MITGGSGSGKSTFAESLLTKSLAKEKYYLATMQVYGDEGRSKVERHRKLRGGKGFITVEQPFDIEDALSSIASTESAVLVECMSNLVANEMFKEAGIVERQEVVNKVISEMKKLAAGVKELIIVTNNVFEDGITYEMSTKEYIKALGTINVELADMSDEAYEVVVGIPVLLKGVQK